ncbi:putative lipoprotein YiaD precursor [Vibrio thalassae]|uniref:Putative lipoprotein YiaD n=1 Tax=Vibrio thalassae TaxID=1243014 RepID=A0A240EFF0_9VIBR|nr:OmpA family protein [Vibrio thalassae]SNX47251.1 putative lipoprotein YiaD precursor [Vibrio thalassae]
MKKIGLFIGLVTLTGAVAANEIVDYSATPYINNQYVVLKDIFKNLKITQKNNGEITIVIPMDYGFQTGKSALKRPMQDQLALFSQFLNTYPESTIRIYGHTDNVGSAASNLKLGFSRARSVENVLVSNNVHQFRITTRSEGEEVPACSNSTPKGRECNRRVEMVLRVDKPQLF